MRTNQPRSMSPVAPGASRGFQRGANRRATPGLRRGLSLSPSRVSSLQPPASSLRRGISLLEVLISMFVLLFGLMGVAAVFPVGNHYAGRGDQHERAAAMTDAAFAELTVRGILRPQHWMYPNGNWVTNQDPSDAAYGTFNVPIPVNGTQPGPGYAFVIDPMGAAQGVTTDVFPYAVFSANPSVPDPVPEENPWVGTNPGMLPGNKFPLRRLTLPQALGAPMTPQVAETIFRLRDDLSVELPEAGDRPGIQRWRTDTNGTLLARDYTGSYSWLATVVPTSDSPTSDSLTSDSLSGGGVAALQPAAGLAGSALYDVSVAVFYKRDLPPSATSERSIAATLNIGGELVVSGTPSVVDEAFEDIRAGQWIALAGVHPTKPKFLLKWYRLLSLDEETDAGTNERRAMLEGPDWPPPLDPNETTVSGLRAILLPGVISVSTQTVPMERE